MEAARFRVYSTRTRRSQENSAHALPDPNERLLTPISHNGRSSALVDRERRDLLVDGYGNGQAKVPVVVPEGPGERPNA